MGVPLPSPPSLQKSSSSFMVSFYWNLKQNIFICLTIIIEITIYKWGPPASSAPLPLLEKVKLFIYGAILLKFEIHIYMFININWDWNSEMLVLPPPFHWKKSNSSFTYSVTLLKFETEHFYMHNNNNWDEHLEMGFQKNTGFLEIRIFLMPLISIL